MKIAIYARKSKLTDKGESIENQISTCKDYIMTWCNIDKTHIEFTIYKDEGFSGGNTDRPQFQKLIKDAKKRKFNILVCYRLDRVSRSVSDFTNTYELLQQYNIEFISVKEQFDTSTPLGRAMLNISMVFAQLERETIAERIKDNMLALAKTGRWLGGTTPAGFISSPIEYIDHDMRAKKMFKLIVNPEEMQKVKTIYSKFFELRSLRSVESYLLINDIYTRKNCKYSPDTIKDILTNPTYVVADESIYHYFKGLGCQICNEPISFDGKHGLMVYNRTSQSGKKRASRPYEDWIISIGQHEPLILGEQWILIQNILASNTGKAFYNKQDMQYGLLTNLIKCKLCHSRMKIKKGKVNSKGETAYVYVCSTKDISRRHKCNVANIIGQDADTDVLDYLLELSQDQSFMQEILSANQLTITRSIEETNNQVKELNETIQAKKKAIDNLMGQLAKLPADSSIAAIYMNQLASIDKEIKEITDKITMLRNTEDNQKFISVNIDSVRAAFDQLKYMNTTTDIKLKRSIIRTIIDYITWDGENLHVELFGQEELKQGLPTTHLWSDSKCHSNG